MGIFDKLFHRKKDDFGFDDLAQQEIDKYKTPVQDNLGLEQKPFDFGEKSPFPEALPRETGPFSPSAGFPLTPPPGAGDSKRDLELLNSKLDTIKAMLTSLDQRLANLERAAGVEKKERLW